MSTRHSKAAEKFLQDSKMAAWHNETLWLVRAKRDKMSKEVPEWEELRNKACELKLYSNSHLEELLLEFEKNAFLELSLAFIYNRFSYAHFIVVFYWSQHYDY